MARKKAAGAPPQEEDKSDEASNKRPTRSAKAQEAATPSDGTKENEPANTGRVTRSGIKSSTTTGVERASGQRPTAKAMAKSKKAANNATDAPKHDKNASRNPDNTDEGVTGAPRNKKDTQKKRQHAPVTVPESSESEEDAQVDEKDDKDRGNEHVIENDAGTQLYPNKRKRGLTSSTDNPAIEEDDSEVGSTLPRIQTRQADNHQRTTTLQVRSSSPPTPDPPSPDTVAKDKDNGVKNQKSIPSRTLKAIQMAHEEEPKFIDDDSDDDVPVTKRHRVTAGDSNKPAVAKESPVFSAIYRSTTLEVKRQMFFVDAFPTSTKSDTLPRRAYDHGITVARESGSFSRNDLQGVEQAFNGKWRASLNHQISSLRTQLKTATVSKVNIHFSRMSNEARKRLVVTNKYWYQVLPTGEADLRRPFLNEAIIDIIKERYFQGRKSLYQLFPEEFTPSLTTEDGGKGQEVPARLVALVTTFVYYALTTNGKSSESWKYETFNQVYDGHLAELKKLQDDNPKCYHLILNRVFLKCLGDKAPVLTQPAVSKNDYRSLDPGDLSD